MPFSTRRPLSAIALTVLLVLTASSCHKKQVAVPVPSEPVPVPAAEAPQPKSTAPAQPTTTPAATAPAPTTTSPPKEEYYQKNKPADQPPPPKRVSRPVNPAPTTPATQPAAPNTPPADAPRLGDVLTPDQQHQYNAAIDVSLAHAQASLGFISTRQLTKEQQATVAEIQNFMQQAQEKRKDELAAAKSLAERAEVLSHDLVASLR